VAERVLDLRQLSEAPAELHQRVRVGCGPELPRGKNREPDADRGGQGQDGWRRGHQRRRGEDCRTDDERQRGERKLSTPRRHLV
jgi:hypothetical protein